MATQEVKAWTFTNGFPKSLKPSTVKVPQANKVNSSSASPHLLVKIEACALNPVDVQRMNLPKWKIPFGDNQAEKGTVMDFSGTVAAGEGKGVKKGDDVFGLTLSSTTPGGGALAEMANFDLATTLAITKPKEWTHEQAAAVPLVWLTAKVCVESVASWVEASSSKRVAILGGSSATGIYSIILAKRKGWKVVTTSSGRNKEFVTSTLKADAHVDYTKQDVREGVAAFQPDAVIDCVGGTECLGLPSSKRYVTIVGDKTGRSSMGGPYTYYDYFSPMRAAAQWIRWTRGYYGLGESYDIVIMKLKKEWLEEAKETLAPSEIFIDSVFPFDDAMKAFERLNTGRSRGKVVIKTGTSSGKSRL